MTKTKLPVGLITTEPQPNNYKQQRDLLLVKIKALFPLLEEALEMLAFQGRTGTTGAIQDHNERTNLIKRGKAALDASYKPSSTPTQLAGRNSHEQ